MASLVFLPLMLMLGASAPEAPAPTQRSLPFSPQAVVEQLQFSFRPADAGFVGGHRTYRVAHDRGQLTVLPLSPRSDPAQPHPEGLTLGTAEVLRGARALRLTGARPHVAPDGSLQVQRGGVEERFHNSAGGVEQSWHFARLPAGRGDLTVRVPVRGLSYQGTTDSGLHFSDAATGAGLRYGLGTWIDARGQRTGVVPVFQDGAIVLTVPEATLKASVFPAVLDPVLGPEFGIDQPVVSVEPSNQSTPYVATDGANFLVAWTDTRSGASEQWATRVTPQGQVLDPGGFRVPDILYCGSYAMTYGAGAYVLACPRGMVRISSDGVVLDPQPMPFTQSAGTNDLYPAIAFNGTNFLLTWTGFATSNSPSGGLYGMMVSPSGSVVMGRKLLSQYSNTVLESAVTAVGTSFRVVYTEDASSMLSVVVYENGAVSPRVQEYYGSLNGQPRFPALASNGDEYAVVYQYGDIYGDASTRISGIIRRADGGSSYATLSTTARQERPDIAWVPTAEAYGVVWTNTRNHSTDRTEIQGAWMDSDGGVAGGMQLTPGLSGQLHDRPRIAGGEGGSMVVWNRKLPEAGRDVMGRALEGTASNVLSTSGNFEAEPAVAAGPGGYFVAWKDSRNHATKLSDLMGARLSPTGEVLDASGIVIASTVREEASPVVTWNGTDWLVAWVERLPTTGTSLKARRVSASGQWVDTTPLNLGPATYASAPSAANGAAGAVVTWAGLPANGVQAALVRTDGGVTTLAGLPTDGGTRPSVTGNASQYLVAWEDTGAIRAQRFNAQGVAQGSRFDVTTSGRQPLLATTGTDFLATYAQGSTSAPDIRSVFISSSGLVATSSALLGSASSDVRPALVWDGRTYTAAWLKYDASRPYYQACRVTRTGAVFDTTPFALFPSHPEQAFDKGDYGRLGLASVGDGSLLAVTPFMDRTPGVVAQRLRARRVE
ncbi:MAG: hypothetical protein EOO71_13335 [Myxococcaceae bacterium]|nr:MAG: hypothetical protein EOO71_13335 [Myxococcaceae bacterium]